MSTHYPKSARLRNRRQYQSVARDCKRYVGSWVVIDARKNRNGVVRLGITATRRFGKAHERNRFKRIAREAFRLCRTQLVFPLDLIVKPLVPAKKAKMADIMSDILKFDRSF